MFPRLRGALAALLGIFRTQSAMQRKVWAYAAARRQARTDLREAQGENAILSARVRVLEFDLAEQQQKARMLEAERDVQAAQIEWLTAFDYQKIELQKADAAVSIARRELAALQVLQPRSESTEAFGQ